MTRASRLRPVFRTDIETCRHWDRAGKIIACIEVPCGRSQEPRSPGHEVRCAAHTKRPESRAPPQAPLFREPDDNPEGAAHGASAPGARSAETPGAGAAGVARLRRSRPCRAIESCPVCGAGGGNRRRRFRQAGRLQGGYFSCIPNTPGSASRGKAYQFLRTSTKTSAIVIFIGECAGVWLPPLAGNPGSESLPATTGTQDLVP